MKQKGLTAIELLVVVGVVAILGAIFLVILNPSRQFAIARDTQRRADLYSLVSAVHQYAIEHQGALPDTVPGREDNFPTVATCVGTNPECFNLEEAGDVDPFVPTYIAQLPQDPVAGTDANTQYFIYATEEGAVIASASGELTPTITFSR